MYCAVRLLNCVKAELSWGRLLHYLGSGVWVEMVLWSQGLQLLCANRIAQKSC